MSLPRVVLDTNCLVSALIFSRGRFAWLREAWQAKRFIALASRDTISELLRVLAYPKFKLSTLEQQELLADFLPYADVVELPMPWPDLPICRDEKDQVIADRDAALEVLGKGVAFLEAIASRNTR